LKTQDKFVTREQAAKQKLEDRESWHKLSVKIIVWNGINVDINAPQKGSGSYPDKITRSEWNKYRAQIIKTNLTSSKQKVLEDLKFLMEKIKANGGFED
jgi:hypothetical protein